MHILNQIFKVLLRFVICIAIVAGVLAIALALNVISYITLRYQSYDWYNYIDTSSMEYIEENEIEFWYRSWHGSYYSFPLKAYPSCEIDIAYDISEKETAEQVLSEIKRIARQADELFGGTPSQVTVEYRNDNTRMDIIIKKPASSPFTFIPKKDKALYDKNGISNGVKTQ